MGLFSKPKAPTPPDLVAAANAQGTQNQAAATDVMNANRYGQVGPEGSSNQWRTDPNTGAVTNVTQMGAQPQAMYDALMNNGTADIGAFQNKYWGGSGGGAAPDRAAIAGGYYGGGGGGSAGGGVPGGIYAPDPVTGTGGVAGGIQSDLDYSHLAPMPGSDPAAARQEAQDALYKMQSQYLDPEFAKSGAALTGRLSNMGLVPGTKAYQNAMQVENDAKQKAYESARTSAIAGGGAEQERQQALALALRNQGITEAGNLGGFHNAAQGQRAGQLLTDIGQQRSLEGSLANANASMAGSSLAAQTAAGRLGLDTRSQEFAEAMGMGKGANAFLPQFGTSQGNMPNYAAAPTYNATQNQYQDALSQFSANRGNSMLPAIGSLAGMALGGPLGGMIGGGLSGMFKGGGIGLPGMQSPGGYGDLY